MNLFVSSGKDAASVSTHRANRRRARDVADDASAPVTGRPRVGAGPRRSTGVSLSSMIGGAALLAAAVGAATAGQAISANQTTTPTASHNRGAYVANLSSASLEGRNATQVSRSAVRPSLLGADASSKSAAEKQAEARVEQLRLAADNAENYAQELSSNEWVLPTSGFHITVWFGEAGAYWQSGYHTGIDFATGYGTPAVAVGNAAVVQTGWDGPYGNQIRLQFENGDQVWYNHLSAIEVTVGQLVVKGQEIGRVGDTGNSFGDHLHFEYRLVSDLHTAVDPLPYFIEHGITL